MLVLERWPIELPAGLELGPTVAMPLVLENDLSAFRFDAHATLGAVLSSVACKEGDETFEFRTTPDPQLDTGERNLGLWQMDCGLESDEEDRLTVTPEGASEFECRSIRSMTGDRGGALLFWRGVRVDSPPKPQTVFFVAQLVVLDEDDALTEWRTWVGRERGTTASIEAVESPSIHLRGPVTPRPGETHLAAQRRTRLLIPTSSNFSVGMGNVPATLLLNGVNWPLYHWSAFDVKNVLVHPNDQQQQFQAVHAADSRDAASFRRLMYFATQDTTGHAKHFHHEGFQLEEQDGPAGWYNWRARYVPGYEDALSKAGDKPRTRFGNTFVTPYPAVVGPMLAKTDEFWFDVTERYREFVESSGMWEQRVVDDPDRGSVSHGAPVLGCNDTPGGPHPTGRSRHADFLESVRILRKGLDPFGRRTPLINAQLQTVRRDGLAVWTPDHPIVESIDPAMVALARQATSEGILVSYYVQPYAVVFGVTPNWKDLLPPLARGYDRDGQPSGGKVFQPEEAVEVEGEPVQYVLDYGSPIAQTWFLDNVYGPLLEKFAMHSAYTDVFAGHGTAIFYDPPAPLEATHVEHGGDYYMQGKRAFVSNLRQFMKSLAERRGEDPRRYSIFGEIAEEFLADKYDAINAGYSYFGNHLMFAEDVALRWLAEYTGDPDPEDAFDGVPAVSRNMSPPLWNMVHHEWAPGQRVTGQWHNVGLSTNRLFYPTEHHFSESTPPYTGIPPDRFVDLYCFTQALLVNEGVRPSLFIYYRHVDDRIRPQSSRLWTLDDAGNVRVDPRIDPEGAGLKLREFYAMLHEAMAEGPLREFVLYGRMERPLEVEDAAQEADLRTNPMFFVFGQTSPFEFVVEGLPTLFGKFIDPGPVGQPKDLIVVGPYATFQFHTSRYVTGFLDHAVLPVQHSLWRGPDGTLGVVLINWSSEPAHFSGVLCADSYGLHHEAGVHARAYRGPNAVTGWGHLRGTQVPITTKSNPPSGSLEIPMLQRRSLTVVVLRDARRPFVPS